MRTGEHISMMQDQGDCAQKSSPTFNTISANLQELNNKLDAVQSRCNTLSGAPNDEKKECDSGNPICSVGVIHDYVQGAIQKANTIMKDLDNLIG
ncbi:MAG TPA: hypothetical protein ENI23_08920 [bacterium]|nr:hypothetical protein [bacterium]